MNQNEDVNMEIAMELYDKVKEIVSSYVADSEDSTSQKKEEAPKPTPSNPKSDK